MASKSAFLAVIDANMPVERLHAAGTIIQKLLQQKLWEGRKTDRFGIITFGTPTKNALHRPGSSDYQNVTIAHALDTPSIEMLRFVSNQLTPSDNPADLLDALIIAVQHLMEETTSKSSGKPLKFDRNIVLISDAEHDFATADAEAVAQKIDAEDIALTIISINQNQQDNSATKVKNKAILEALAQAARGSFVAHVDALQSLSDFQTKRVNPTAVYRGPLSFGSIASEISIQCFNKTSELKPPSASKVSALGHETGAIDVKRTYTVLQKNAEDNQAGQEIVVPPEEIIRTQRYGHKLIPMAEADEEAEKLATTKGLTILGFVDKTEVGRHLFLNNTILVKPEKDSHASALGLSALAISLSNTNRVALCRYVSADNRSPKMGVMIPNVTEETTALYFVQLPFADDVREFKFDKLEDVLLEPMQRKNGKRHRFDHRAVPATEVNQRMDAWIDSMDLMTAARDSEGNPCEAYQVKDIHNPGYHRIFEAVAQRAVDPNAPIPPPDRFVQSMQPLPDLFARARPHFELVKASFQGIRRPVKAGTKRMFVVDESVDLQRPAPTPAAQMSVGTSDPVGDFQKMVGRRDLDLVGEGCKQMQTAILSLIDHWMGPRAGPVGQVAQTKILDSLKALRDTSGEEGEDLTFNDWMRTVLKPKLLNGTDQEREFWTLLKDKKCGLIDTDFANATKPVSKHEAEQFWTEAMDVDALDNVIADYNQEPEDEFDDLA